MSNIKDRVEKNIFLTNFGTYQVNKFQSLGHKVKTFKTLEEAKAYCEEIKNSIKDRTQANFSYPDNLFEELFEDKDFIDVNYVYNHFEENLKYILQNEKHYLTERELCVFGLYYIDGYTLEAVGHRLNVSRERIRQILAKAKRKFRHPATLEYLRYGYETIQKQDDIKKIEALIQEEKARLIEELRKPTLTGEDLVKAQKPLSIDILNLSTRGHNSLVRASIRTIKDLIKLTSDELYKIRNLGKKTHKEIVEKLKENGYSLKEERNE